MIRVIALLLTVLTGFTALVYQVAWQKYLAALLGSDSEAVAIVLAIFLGGLSWGYALFGRLSRRMAERSGADGPTRLLRTYGLVEGGIGVYALVFPWLFLAVRSVSLKLSFASDLLSFAVDLLLTALLIGPPAVLMGGTVPLLTQALSRRTEEATRIHAFVYGFNTVGAFLGVLCGGFFLVPWLGLRGVLLATGAGNLVAGVAYLGLARLIGPGALAGKAAKPPAPEAAGRVSSVDLRVYLAAAGLAGFAMMAVQTVVNRIVSLSIGSSPFTFATVVAVFVLCIALGSLVVSCFPRIPRAVLPATQWVVAGWFVVLYLGVSTAPYWAHVVRSMFRSDPQVFYAFHATIFLGLLALMLVPLALSGAALPLIFQHLRRELGGLGGVAGTIYSWNTVGSLAGALLGGYVLLFWLDLHAVFRIAMVALIAAAALLTSTVYRRARAAVGIAFIIAGIVTALLPAWSSERLSAGPFRLRRANETTWLGPDAFFENYLPRPVDGVDPLVFYDDDPTASIAVIRYPIQSGVSLAVKTNGKTDGALPADKVTAGMLALLPAIMAAKAERAFVVGYGTGLTVGELAHLSTMKEVIVAEISSGVVRAAPLFEQRNGGAAAHPKTTIVRSDAYRALQRTQGKFDVISSEPSNPWVSGIEMLYSLEFLRAARERLEPGGVFCQWIHLYETDDATLELVLNNFRTAFDEVSVWYGLGQDMLLLGFKDGGPPIDLATVEQRWARPDFSAAFRRLDLNSLGAFLSHELLPVGVLHETELPEELHTVLHPRLGHLAARAYFTGGRASVPVDANRAAARAGAANSFLGAYLRQLGPDLTDDLRLAVIDEVCRNRTTQCAAHLARWQFDKPGSQALADKLAQLRQSSNAREFSGQYLFRLATLFSESGTAPLPPQYEYAERVREMFLRYYDHAVPFDARALHGPWQRCGEPRCEEERERVLALGISP